MRRKCFNPGTQSLLSLSSRLFFEVPFSFFVLLLYQFCMEQFSLLVATQFDVKFAKVGKLLVGVQFLQVEGVAEWKLKSRHKRRSDVDAAGFPQRFNRNARGGTVEFLQLHLCVAKDNRLVCLELLDLSLSCQVFAFHVGAHLAQEFLSFECFLQHKRQCVFFFAEMEGSLVLGVLKMVKPVLASAGTKDSVVVFLSGFLVSGISGSIAGVSVHVDSLFVLVVCFQYYGFISFQFSVCGK